MFVVTTHYITADSFDVFRVHDIIKLQILCKNFSLSQNQSLDIFPSFVNPFKNLLSAGIYYELCMKQIQNKLVEIKWSFLILNAT